MTTLPPPPGYKNTGKGVSRHLTHEDDLIVADFIRRRSVSAAITHFNLSAFAVSRIVKKFKIKPRRRGNYTNKEIAAMKPAPYEVLSSAVTTLVGRGVRAKYEHHGVLVVLLIGYVFRLRFTGTAFEFVITYQNGNQVVAGDVTMPEDATAVQVVEFVQATLIRYSHVTGSQRFVLAVGAYREQFPDMPDGLNGPHCTCLWDRQEGKVVMMVHEPYGQLICLERVNAGAVNSPFTALEHWLNHLANSALESEGIPATKPKKKKK